MSFWGISSRNIGQKRAMQALINDKPFAFLTGPAGTGKTLITQAVGLHRMYDDKKFRKLVYTRLQVQLGAEQGFLPGNIDEKTYPFVRPFLDNLEVMSDKSKAIIEYLMSGTGDKRQVFFDPIQTMRGGSFHHSFLIVDESQNIDVATIHAIATRLAEGSKIIFLGNFAQIDTPKLRSAKQNGLYQLLNGLYEKNAHEYFDHINLTDVERHPAVQLVESILRDHTMPVEFEALETRGNIDE
jgi:predicted ribonuclease YlaK